MLKRTFIELVRKYSDDTLLEEVLWSEIENKYSEENRHYHTLAHLDCVLRELKQVESLIKDWDTVLFAAYYHDIIYNVANNDNEEKSAVFMRKQLAKIKSPLLKIPECEAHILATKHHIKSNKEDVNCLLDADLSILGQERDSYLLYCRQVRREYSIYSNATYNAGRADVLNRMLEKEQIFKTSYFLKKYEVRARANINKELAELKK